MAEAAAAGAAATADRWQLGYTSGQKDSKRAAQPAIGGRLVYSYLPYLTNSIQDLIRVGGETARGRQWKVVVVVEGVAVEYVSPYQL